MYIEVLTAFIILYRSSSVEGGVTSRFKRDTGRTHVENIYSRYKQASPGEATYYGNYPGGGACALDPLSPLANQPGWIRVAAADKFFQNSLGCGMCLEITGTGVGKGDDPINGPLKGVVHDRCGCNQVGVDLFIVGDGKWDVNIKAIDCPKLPGSDGNIMLRFTGSNPWYIKLQARNARIPVAGIEVLKNDRYYCLRRATDNYFVGDGLGKVDFPMQVRLTAVNGEQRETIIPVMKNDEDTTSDIQFTGHATGSGPSNILCMGQGNKPPYPQSGLEPGSPGTSTGGQPGTSGAPAPAPAPAPPPKPQPPLPPTPGTENNDFCKDRPSGVYVDPVYCRAFIICNNKKVNRQFCAKGQLFNSKGMNCDLETRVDCGSRSRDDPPQKKYTEAKYTDMVMNNDIQNGHVDGPTVGETPISVHYKYKQLGSSKEKMSGKDEKKDENHQDLNPNLHVETNITGKANQPLIYMTKEQRQLNKSEDRPHLDVDAFSEDAKKDRKIKPDESGKRISTLSSRPLVHVTIDSDQGADTNSSSKASDKPSLEISVNNDGIKARFGGHGRDNKQMDHQEFIGNSGTLHFQLDNKGIQARVGSSEEPHQQQDKKEPKGDDGVFHMQVNGNGIHARLGGNRGGQDMDSHAPKNDEEIIHMQVNKGGFHARLGGNGGHQMKDSEGSQGHGGQLHMHVSDNGIHIGSSSDGQEKDGQGKDKNSGDLHMQVDNDGIHAHFGKNAGRTEQKDSQGKQEDSGELHLHVNNDGIHIGSSSGGQQKEQDSHGKQEDTGVFHMHVNNDGIHAQLGGNAGPKEQKDSQGNEEDTGVFHMHVNNDGIHAQLGGNAGPKDQKDSQGKEEESEGFHMHVNNDGIHIGRGSSGGQQKEQDSQGQQENGEVFHMQVDSNGFNARVGGSTVRKQGKHMDGGNSRDNRKVVQVQGKIGVAKNNNVKANFELTIRKDSDRILGDSSRQSSPDPDHKEQSKETHKESNDEHQRIQNSGNHETNVSSQSLKHPVHMNDQPSLDKNDGTKEEKPGSVEASRQYQTNEPLKYNNNLTDEHAKSAADIQAEEILPLPQSDEPTILINNDNLSAKNNDTSAPSKVDAMTDQHPLAANTASLLQHEKDINEGPRVTFHHPIEALTAYQNHLQMKGEEGKTNEQSMKITGHYETSGKENTQEKPVEQDNQVISKEDGKTNDQGVELTGQEQTNGKENAKERPSAQSNEAITKDDGKTMEQKETSGQEKGNENSLSQAIVKEDSTNEQGIKAEEQASGKSKPDETQQSNNDQSYPKEDKADSQVIRLTGNGDSFGNEKAQETAGNNQIKPLEQGIKMTGEEVVGTEKPSDNNNLANQQEDVKVVSEENIFDKNDQENTNPTFLMDQAEGETNENENVQIKPEYNDFVDRKVGNDTPPNPTVDIFMDDASVDTSVLHARSKTDDAVARSNSARPVGTTKKKADSYHYENLPTKKHEVKGYKHRHHHHHHHKIHHN